ncbi:hypothetical protein [Streptomyces sp. NPDC004065]|uniref:hypothetical protein n=1 Tax=Streptomyces sp. NPDC004065 TaxID=3364689 RepID=UPI00384ECC37
MSLPAALTVAASRMVRTAAGRRALHLGLLVAALCALGFLCGGRAHAAETAPGAASAGAPVAPSAAGGPTSTPSDSPERTRPTGAAAGVVHAARGLLTAPDARRAHRDGPSSPGRLPHGASRPAATRSPLGRVLAPVTGSVAGAVTERVIEPVVEPVERLVDGVAGDVAGGTVRLPPVASLPGLPGGGRSDAPVQSVPRVPGLPGPAARPGDTPPAPATRAPQPHPAGGTAGTAGTASGGQDAAAHSHDIHRAGNANALAPRPTPGNTAAAHGVPRAEGDAHPTRQAPYAPAHQAPPGDPNGLLSDHSAADPGTPRHSDTHAVTPGDRTQARLPAGAAAHEDASVTRDRYRDIPVLPG